MKPKSSSITDGRVLGIILVKIIAAIFDFYNSGGPGRERN